MKNQDLTKKIAEQLVQQEKREKYLIKLLESLPEESLEVNPYERIDLLEKRLESVLERLEELEKYCFTK